MEIKNNKVFYILFESKLINIILIFCLGAVIYSNSLHNSFQLDDYRSIVDNLSIRNLGNLKAIFNFWPTRFLTYLSLALNYQFGGLGVLGYHLFNALLHIGCAISGYWLALLTFSTPAMKKTKIAGHAGLFAFFTGLLFLAHPIQTQAVTYIIQRAASLATFFYLVSLCFYSAFRQLREATGDKAGKAGIFYFSAFIAAAAAMFSKEMAVTLPLAVLFYEFCFFKAKKNINWKYVTPFFATLLIIPLTFIFTKSLNLRQLHLETEPHPGILPWHYFLTQLRVMVTYLRLLILPLNQNLDYDYAISKSIFELPVLLSLIILGGIVFIGVRIFKRQRLVSFCIFWFFLTLLPESSIIAIKDVIYEHRLYLPIFGFSLLLTVILFYLLGKRSLKPLVVALTLIVICFSFLAYDRNFIWKNEFTLWDDVISKSRHKVRPYMNRGTAYYLKYELDRAIADWDKATEIDPEYAESYLNRGVAYKEKGDFERAIREYNKAIQINPDLALAYNNRGNIYKEEKKYDEAISDYTKAIQIDPNLAMAYNNRAFVYFLKKQYDESWKDVQGVRSLGYDVNLGFLESLKKLSGREK